MSWTIEIELYILLQITSHDTSIIIIISSSASITKPEVLHNWDYHKHSKWSQCRILSESLPFLHFGVSLQSSTTGGTGDEELVPERLYNKINIKASL